MLRNFQTASPDRYELLKKFAIENRKNPTEAESFLWQYLKGKSVGFKFNRQHVIYDYIVDFVCLEKNLVIEVDGAYHFTEEQSQLDFYRAENLSHFGFCVIRFTNEEALFEIDKVISKIKAVINII